MKLIYKKIIFVAGLFLVTLVVAGCSLQEQMQVEANTSYENTESGVILTNDTKATVVVELEGYPALVNEDTMIDVDISNISLVYSGDERISLPLAQDEFTIRAMAASEGMLVSSANVPAGELQAMIITVSDLEFSGSTFGGEVEIMGDNAFSIPVSMLQLEGNTVYTFTIDIDSSNSLSAMISGNDQIQTVSLDPMFTLTVRSQGVVTVSEQGYVGIADAQFEQAQEVRGQVEVKIKASRDFEQQRNSFRADAQARIHDINTELGLIVDQARAEGKNISAAVQARIEAAQIDIQSTVQSMQEVGLDTWTKTQAEVSASIDEIEAAVDDIQADLGIDAQAQGSSSTNARVGTGATNVNNKVNVDVKGNTNLYDY